MRKLLALLLSAVILMSLCACSGTAENTDSTTPGCTTEATKSSDPAVATDTTVPEETKPPYNGPEIQDKLTWEKINAFPIKHSGMTEDEMRNLCVDFFRFTKTALWTPSDSVEFTKTNKGATDTLYQGQIYGGLPYIPVASGSIYRLMDYIDEQTGEVDIVSAMENPQLFGNQCSIGAYWGWSRVINSADYSWTYMMVQQNGFLRVGPYTYDDKLIRFEDGFYTTKNVVQENGPEIMFQSYAAMKHGDGLINYTTAGHTMMCSADPVVVYAADGSIDGAQSYLHIIDQHVDWSEHTNQAGDTYQNKNYVDRKFTFIQLMNDAYIPFTFAEFQGTDPVEETKATFSHTGESITCTELLGGEVTANYGISDIYAIVKDSSGKEVARAVNRASSAGVMTLNFARTFSIGDWETYTDGSYIVEVSCQLGTGERPTVYTGKLTK